MSLQALMNKLQGNEVLRTLEGRKDAIVAFVEEQMSTLPADMVMSVFQVITLSAQPKHLTRSATNHHHLVPPPSAAGVATARTGAEPAPAGNGPSMLAPSIAFLDPGSDPPSPSDWVLTAAARHATLCEVCISCDACKAPIGLLPSIVGPAPWCLR